MERRVNFVKKYFYGELDIISTICEMLYMNDSIKEDKSNGNFTELKQKFTKKKIIENTKDFVINIKYEQTTKDIDPNYNEQDYWDEAEKIYKSKFDNKMEAEK